MEECRCTQVRCTPHTNWNWWYRALLQQVSLTCSRMQTYPVQMYTSWLIEPSGTAPYCTRSKKTNEFKISDETYTYPVQMYPYHLLIDPTATESYYTMSVWHVTACRCTKVRCMPQPHPYSGGEEYYITSCFYLLHRYGWNAKISYKQMFYCSFHFISCEDSHV